MDKVIDADARRLDNTSESEGFMGLFIVQLMGVLIAIGLTLSLHKVHPDPIPNQWLNVIYVLVGLVFVMTIFVAFRQTEFLSFIWNVFKGAGAAPKGVIEVREALCIYFLTDFAVLGFLIYATGGSEQSLFSTFLFVLVPITIALGNQPGWKIVLGFAGITIVIFLVLVWLESPAHIHHVNGVNYPRRVWFAIITSACVIFPTAVYCIQNLGQPQATSGGNGTSRMRVAGPSGAESNALPMRDGVVDRTDPLGAIGE